MDSAKYIFDRILKYADNGTVSLCSLHAPCKGNFCGTPQKTQVIEFDNVKRKWDDSLKQPHHSSVDALTYNNKLCFVEIKGWTKFLEKQKILKKKNLTEKDEELGYIGNSSMRRRVMPGMGEFLYKNLKKYLRLGFIGFFRNFVSVAP